MDKIDLESFNPDRILMEEVIPCLTGIVDRPEPKKRINVKK